MWSYSDFSVTVTNRNYTRSHWWWSNLVFVKWFVYHCFWINCTYRKYRRNTNEIRRYFTDVAVLNVVGVNKKFDTKVRIKHFTCNKRKWLETFIEWLPHFPILMIAFNLGELSRWRRYHFVSDRECWEEPEWSGEISWRNVNTKRWE
jgi:hypothetical protein